MVKEWILMKLLSKITILYINYKYNIDILQISYKAMLSYLVQCKKGRANINPRVSKASNGRIMILLNCAMYKQ